MARMPKQHLPAAVQLAEDSLLTLLHVTPRRARRLGASYADVLAAAVAARRLAAQPQPHGLVVRPFDPRAHVVRDVCGPLQACEPTPVGRTPPPGS